MPLSKVQPGMTGTSKTVFMGDTIEEFGVEVLDIIPNYYPQQDVILVRLTGEKVEHTGVVAGMSGSPVYIDGKLVGALSFGFGLFSKEPLAGITPIEQMFAVLHKEKTRELEETHRANTTNPYLDLVLGWEDGQRNPFVLPERLNGNPLDEGGPGYEIPAPMMFSGFHASVINHMKEALGDMGLIATQGGGVGSSSNNSGREEPVRIRPGDAISQVIIDGDMGIDVAGTVTWCNGDSILAFGHPLFGAGSVRIPMGQTRILTTIPSLMSSNKLATVTQVVGTFRQDRLSGLLGIVGDSPPTIPVKVRCTTVDDVEREFSFRVATERRLSSLTPFYMRAAILNAVITSRLSGGDFSLRVQGHITLADGQELELDDLFAGSRAAGFFSPASDAIRAADNVTAILAALMVNRFKEAEISDVELNFTEIPGFASAEVVGVWCDKEQVSPGDTVTVTVLLSPFQSTHEIKISRQVEVPIGLDATYVTLFVGGGAQLTSLERRTVPRRFVPRSYSHLLDLLDSRRRNDRLYIQLVAPFPGTVVEGEILPDLPTSVLSVMDSRSLPSRSLLNRHVLIEESIPTDIAVSGGKMIRLQLAQRGR